MNGEPQSSLIGPYNEGDRLVLVCEVEGGKPTPTLTWWRESVLLDDSYDMTGSGTSVRNEMEIQSLQRHDLMAVFTCQASNNNISMPTYAAVSVDLNCKSTFCCHFPIQCKTKTQRFSVKNESIFREFIFYSKYFQFSIKLQFLYIKSKKCVNSSKPRKYIQKSVFKSYFHFWRLLRNTEH